MSGAAPPATEPRVALVTGASSGFGEAIAVALGGLGWSVALGARREEKLAAVARAVEEAGGKALAHGLDVRDETSVEVFARAAERALGPCDAVVSNAGFALPAWAHEVDAVQVRRELDTNLLGPMLLVRRTLPGLLERGRGDLVFVTSLNAVLPRTMQAGYTASKAGLEAYARVLQMELEGTGVRASIVRPGPSLTEMGWSWPREVVGPMLESWSHWGVLRHHHYLRPEAIARAVVSVVTAPPGTHLDLVQVNPEKPSDG